MLSDVYSRVTDTIVSKLEQGVRPWFQPWSGDHAAGRITRPMRANGVPYRGINVVMLWGAATEKGYTDPLWMTFKQAQEIGAHVRKGERGASSFMPARSTAQRRTTHRARKASSSVSPS